MRKRTIALVGAGVTGAVIALLGAFGRPGAGGSEQATSSPAAADPRGAAAAAEAPNRPPPPPRVSAAPAADIPDLQARDRRRRDAVAPFGASLLAALDTCVPAGPVPRVPQRLLLRFERAKESPPGQETFELRSAVPAGVAPGQPDLRATPLGTCLSGLAGRTLAIPAGPGTQDSSFEEIVTVPIPASVAWAPPQMPVR